MEVDVAESKVPNKFDIAAIDAEKDLISLMNDLSDEEKTGAMAIFHWHAKHYVNAGHKRLGRIHVKLSKGTIKQQ